MSLLRYSFLSLYLLGSAIHLSACLLGMRRLQNVSKVVLLPLLFPVYLAFCPAGGFSPLVAAAIFCGWVGDVFLLFPGKKPCFLTGLAAFLAGHALYAAALFQRGGIPGPLPAALLALVLLGAGAAAYATLRGHLAEMRLPVAAYLAVILTMAFSAVSLVFLPAVPRLPALLAAVGSLCFVGSDYLLARSLFLPGESGALRDFSVMLLYLAAQGCLVCGLALL